MNYINKGKRDILIFPKFDNVEKIQNIRKKYDELYDLIEPHITVAFPFSNDISNKELKTKLIEVLKEVKPFKVVCEGVSLKKDNRIGKYYIFLNITEGKEKINNIHLEVYNKILPNVDIKKYNYEPHITLGTTENSKEQIILNEKFETIIDEISVEEIGKNEESNILFTIKMGRKYKI